MSRGLSAGTAAPGNLRSCLVRADGGRPSELGLEIAGRGEHRPAPPPAAVLSAQNIFTKIPEITLESSGGIWRRDEVDGSWILFFPY